MLSNLKYITEETSQLKWHRKYVNNEMKPYKVIRTSCLRSFTVRKAQKTRTNEQTKVFRIEYIPPWQ